MDQNFQTSFIPKKPVVIESIKPRPSLGIFTIFSFLILLAVLFAYGGLNLYKNNLVQGMASKQKALELAKNRFEPGRLAELQTLDKRLKAANMVLDNHIAISPVFEVLERTTMKTVRYTSFTYELRDSMILVKLSGEANGYRSIALQSDLLSQDKDIKEPVFSNLALDSKGSVLFDLTFSVSRSLVSYKDNLNKGSYLNESEVNNAYNNEGAEVGVSNLNNTPQ